MHSGDNERQWIYRKDIRAGQKPQSFDRQAFVGKGAFYFLNNHFEYCDSLGSK